MVVFWSYFFISVIFYLNPTCVQGVDQSLITVSVYRDRNLNVYSNSCSAHHPMYTVDNSTNILGVYELRSKLNDSVLLACTAGKSKLEHFSRHVFGQRCLLSYQTYYSQIKISRTDIEAYKSRYGSLWRSGRFLVQNRGFLEALKKDSDESNKKEKQTFDQVLQSGVARIKLFAAQRSKSMEVVSQFIEDHFNKSIDINHDNDTISLSDLRYNSKRNTTETLALLKRFAFWFREHFPYYYSQCSACRGLKDGGEYLGCVQSSPEECDNLSNRTELILCKNSTCTEITRFPRYNDVCKVLETKRGRCGEYSILMMSFLESIGYTTRYIVDRDDHVWVEVLLNGEWIHVDPCEAAVDNPLLYESWGKNQTFILSFQQDTDSEAVIVEDVTIKYTSNYIAVMERRIEECVNSSYIEKKISEYRMN